jgi:ABC-2 type transport system ATP-binding protein
VLNEVQLLCKRVAIIKEGKIIKVEDIETLRKKQLKKVHIQFEDQVNEQDFSIHGIDRIITKLHNLLSFMYSGDINELVGSLEARKIVNLTIEEPSLEEIFMHYYK